LLTFSDVWSCGVGVELYKAVAGKVVDSRISASSWLVEESTSGLNGGIDEIGQGCVVWRVSLPGLETGSVYLTQHSAKAGRGKK